MERFDFKKEFKELYQPKTSPSIITVPEMTFITVRGKGDPNTCPEYKEAIEILYGLAFTIKMSKMNGTQPEGYFDFVVPPLEGLWHTEGERFDGVNVTNKSLFHWTSMIRQPEFVTKEVFEAAKAALSKKKPGLDLSKAALESFTEGLCVQVMHKGAYDDEPATIMKMKEFAEKNGYREDFSDTRLHHEIYLSDPRKCAAANLKTVIRHPILLA